MTHKLFIGYKTKAVENVEALMPKIVPSKVLVDEKKIANDIAVKTADFVNGAKDMPYTGILEEVLFLDVKNEKGKQFTHGAKDKDVKGPVALQVRNYLVSTFPDAWSNDIYEMKKPAVVFVGFNPRLFLKILGIECSLPKIAKPLPLQLWYGNRDHRDIEEACCPSDFKRLTLETVIKARRPLDEVSAKAWDKLLEGWTGPGNNPLKDAQLALELAVQLGLTNE